MDTYIVIWLELNCLQIFQSRNVSVTNLVVITKVDCIQIHCSEKCKRLVNKLFFLKGVNKHYNVKVMSEYFKCYMYAKDVRFIRLAL